MKIPLVDLTRNKKVQRSAIKIITKIMDRGDFILGDSVEKFESEYSRYTNAKYCVGVASGTDGILLSLMSLGVNQNDEVIVPAFTFSASLSPILILNAKPVLVDIGDNNPYVDPDAIEVAITAKTKAIIIVHMYGGVCDMDKIMKISKKYNIPIIEDACQAHGSTYKGKHAGTFGYAGVFSFYPGKNLGAFGDAGAVVTNDYKLANKLKALRNHGQVQKYKHEYLGINSRLDSIQAAVLLKKLTQLDKWNLQRMRIARFYNKALKDLGVEIVKYTSEIKPNYHLYVVKTKKRDRLKKFLELKGIQCGIHYPIPLHLNPAFNNLGAANDFPKAEKYARECLSIPIFPGMTKIEVEYIIGNIKEFFGKVA